MILEFSVKYRVTRIINAFFSQTLESAVRLANIGGCKFPPVDLEKIKHEKPKELYIFEDENDPECPIIFWFLLDTAKFRQDREYTPKNHEGKKVSSICTDGVQGRRFALPELSNKDNFVRL